MLVFISYSGHEAAAVQTLVSDLEHARQQVWFDQNLRGGETWWDEILGKIQSCDVFLFALSDRSWQSKACRAEFTYAQQLGRPVLPVQIGQVQNLRLLGIGDTQVIDYRDRTVSSAITLVASVAECAGRHSPLPSPLPAAPQIPFEYLLRLGRQIEADHLTPLEQAGVLAQLRQGWEEEDDDEARSDIIVLIKRLGERADATFKTVQVVNSLVTDQTVISSAVTGEKAIDRDEIRRSEPVQVDPLNGKRQEPRDSQDRGTVRISVRNFMLRGTLAFIAATSVIGAIAVPGYRIYVLGDPLIDEDVTWLIFLSALSVGSTYLLGRSARNKTLIPGIAASTRWISRFTRRAP